MAGRLYLAGIGPSVAAAPGTAPATGAGTRDPTFRIRGPAVLDSTPVTNSRDCSFLGIVLFSLRVDSVLRPVDLHRLLVHLRWVRLPLRPQWSHVRSIHPRAI